MKTNILKNSIPFILYFFLISCSQYENNDKADVELIGLEETGERPSYKAYKNDEGPSNNANQEKFVNHQIKIIRNADCRIQVANVQKAMRTIKNMVKSYDGYVADERFTNTNYVKENRFVIRIPQKNFNTVLDSVCVLASFIDHKNITTRDVTEEYIDISSRLQTKLEVKSRYENILRSKAKTVEDLLMAENKIKDIQEEIESAQGRLVYLSNKVSYSTIHLDLYESIIPKDEPNGYEPGFLIKAKEGISFGWDIVQSLILLLFYIWPVLGIGIVVFVYFKWIRK